MSHQIEQDVIGQAVYRRIDTVWEAPDPVTSHVDQSAQCVLEFALDGWINARRRWRASTTSTPPCDCCELGNYRLRSNSLTAVDVVLTGPDSPPGPVPLRTVPPARGRRRFPAVRRLQVVVVDESPAPRGLDKEAGGAIAGLGHYRQLSNLACIPCPARLRCRAARC